MTQPQTNRKCGRCGKPSRDVKGPGLCADCSGTCRTCGAPASRQLNGYFRPFCSTCRSKGEARETCSKCGKLRDGSHQSYCRDCYRAYSRQWSVRKPEKSRAKSRRRGLAAKKLTVIDFDALLATQGGGCAICEAKQSLINNPQFRGPRMGLHIDHDHTCCSGNQSIRTCGKCTRGILCSACNRGLGVFQDDPVRLRKAADYLDEWAKQRPATVE